MRQTFYLSNMCVQHSQLNQNTWEHLESTCRQWAKKFGGVYIVCGPIFSTKPTKKIGGNLSVPNKFFKVVLCLKGKDGKPQAIGFIYDNVSPKKKDRLESNAVSVDQVEKITGMDIPECKFYAYTSGSILRYYDNRSTFRKYRYRRIAS